MAIVERFSRAAICVAICLLPSCCFGNRESQIMWVSRHDTVGRIIELAGDGVCPAVPAGLVLELFGRPDFAGSPRELHDRLSNDASPEHVMERIFFRFLVAVAGPERAATTPRCAWADSGEFLDAYLWLYDASKQFDKPWRSGSMAPYYYSPVYFIDMTRVAAFEQTMLRHRAVLLRNP